MAERRELGFPKTGAVNLREQLARATLRNVRSQGHPYVELREDGKRFIFFCTLCLSRCYDDESLLRHFEGRTHTERLSAAKVTLLGPNPWPFSDGIHLFNSSTEDDKKLAITDGNQVKSLESLNDSRNFAIVKYSQDSDSRTNGHTRPNEESSDGNEMSCDVIIPGVLIADEISDLEVSSIGFGKISARFLDMDSIRISRIWCEWLGKKHADDGGIVNVANHEFGVVALPYNYELGRKGLIEDIRLMLPCNDAAKIETVIGSTRKRRNSVSEHDDGRVSPSNQYDSSGEESAGSNGSTSRLLLDRSDNQLWKERFISSKKIRKELRKKQRIAAERNCDICQHVMLPGKDVGTLLNMKTGKLACSSRNVNGAFHVFHMSCLIHWILLCEFEMYKSQVAGSKLKRRSKRRNGTRSHDSAKGVDLQVSGTRFRSVFCPECQGTGMDIEGAELEKPTVPLNEIFRYKLKINDGKRAWLRSPERLQNCSVGFHFPSELDESIQENVSPLKLLQFFGPVK